MFSLIIDTESMINYIAEDSSIIYYDIYDEYGEQMKTSEGWPFSLEIDTSDKSIAFINPDRFNDIMMFEKDLFDLVIDFLRIERDFIEEAIDAELSEIKVNFVDSKVWRYNGDYAHKLNEDFYNYMKGAIL